MNSSRISVAAPLNLLGRVFVLAGALVALLQIPAAQGQDFGLNTGPDIGLPSDYVTWTVDVSPERVSPGSATIVRFTALIEGEGDWKMYALDSEMPERTVGARPFGVQVGWSSLPEGVTPRTAMGQARPEQGHDENFDMTLTWFHDEAVLTAVVDVDSVGVDAGQVHTLDARVRYQICSDEFGVCLRPETASVSVPISVASIDEQLGATSDEIEAALVASYAMVASDGDSSRSRGGGRAPMEGLAGFLLLAVGAGLASLLTPCVFPMIPLTVSYFTKHADDRAASVRLASTYGVSIIATFTVIGIVMAIVVGAAGAQTVASNPFVNLFIALVLVAFGLSLLGLYELRVPSGLLNRVNAMGSSTGGHGGVVFMGLTLTLVSFSCTAPFVAGLLAAAAGGSWLFPVTGMVAYSATFAAPFVLFALFPNALQRLPKSGSWMNVIKVVLGFVELAAAVKFFSNADLVWGWGLLSRPLGIAIVLVLFFLAGLYLIGKLRLSHEPPVESIGAGRLMAATTFFVLSLYMLPGLLGSPLNALDAYLPPRQAGDTGLFNMLGASAGSVPAGADDGWYVDDIDAAVVEASERGLPIFVDFTGYTCTNCRAMETNVFPRAEVSERLENNFVRLKLYTDGPELGDEFHRYQLRLTGIVALPTYAIVESDGETLIRRSFGMMNVEQFVAFLGEG